MIRHIRHIRSGCTSGSSIGSIVVMGGQMMQSVRDVIVLMRRMMLWLLWQHVVDGGSGGR